VRMRSVLFFLCIALASAQINLQDFYFRNGFFAYTTIDVGSRTVGAEVLFAAFGNITFSPDSTFLLAAVASASNVIIQHRTRFDYSVIVAGNEVIADSDVVLNHTLVKEFDNENSPFPLEPPQFEVNSGGDDITVEPQTTVRLDPGSYGAVVVSSFGTLILSPGVYAFSSFVQEADSRVVVGIVGAPRFVLILTNFASFGDRTTFVGLIPIFFLSAQESQLTIGNDLVRVGFNGRFRTDVGLVIAAPRAPVVVGARNLIINVAFAGNSIVLQSP
jgi:hypothetical protein